MLLKSDFLGALENAVASRPAAAAAFRAGDPRLMAMMDAMATMLAMLSQQIDTAESEPFVKARTGTILADAALKGVLPLARPARVLLTVTNPGASPVALAAGRGVLDPKGLRYVVEGSATVPATGTATLALRQLSVRTQTHTVVSSAPFYELQVEPSPEALFLAGVDVADAVGPFTYSPEFCNVLPGQRIFHVETDEARRLWLRFGAADGVGPVVGHQPATGDILTITVRECAGAVELDAGAGFALEYVGNADEAGLSLVLDSVDDTGASPPDTETLRMLSRYPAMNDSSAVYLSDFDFLLRRHVAGITFMSVWNEQVEEVVRGASLANINNLFVSFVITGQSTGASEAQIRQVIGRADDSYAVVFVAPRVIQVPVTVTARVSVVHDAGDVEAQIRSTLLAEYGASSRAASRGMERVFRLQQLNAVLKQRVPALQDQISDFSVVLGASPSPLPEDYRYFSPSSITVVVERITDTSGLWSL